MFVVVLVSAVLIACVLVASFVDMAVWEKVAVSSAGAFPFTVGIAYAVRIEQTAGYYNALAITNTCRAIVRPCSRCTFAEAES